MGLGEQDCGQASGGGCDCGCDCGGLPLLSSVMQSSKLEIKWPNKLVREIIHVYMYISLSLLSPVYSALSYIVRCTCAFFYCILGSGAHMTRSHSKHAGSLASSLFGLFGPLCSLPLRPSWPSLRLLCFVPLCPMGRAHGIKTLWTKTQGTRRGSLSGHGNTQKT